MTRTPSPAKNRTRSPQANHQGRQSEQPKPTPQPIESAAYIIVDGHQVIFEADELGHATCFQIGYHRAGGTCIMCAVLHSHDESKQLAKQRKLEKLKTLARFAGMEIRPLKPKR